MKVVTFFLILTVISTVHCKWKLGVAGPRIIGGELTVIEKHPWQISLQVFGNHICAGVIISPDTVLTAAHCVTELIISVYYAVPGVTDLREAELKLPVKDAIIHESYDSDTYDYDIAILKLQDTLTFSEKIQAITLPEQSTTVPVGITLTASGWGVTKPEDDSPISDVLQQVEVLSIDWDKCKTKLTSVGTFSERMICAGVPEGGKDTCQADSGGALELNSTLIGIVSWGEGCGDPNYPGVYTHVSYFRSWITDNAGV